MQERRELCDLFDEFGPSVPTLLEGWTAHDLAAHLVLREHDLVAGPCMVLPGPFQRFAERRRARLAQRKDFTWLVARIRSGPPVGFFRIGWVRALARISTSSLFITRTFAGPMAKGRVASRLRWMRPCGETFAAAAAI